LTNTFIFLKLVAFDMKKLFCHALPFVLVFAVFAFSLGTAGAQTWKLFGISGMQQDATQTVPGTYDHKDHTLFRINTTNGALTKIVTMPWVLDSQSIGYCATNGLIYHTGGDGAYRDDPNRLVHDQDPNVQIPGGAFQDNQYMGTVNLLTLAMAGVYNANPCPNPDNISNDIGNDGIVLPCFGLPAPIPTWVLPQYRRDSTMIDPTNRITGPNEPSGIRGIAWSTELNSWYVSDGNIYKMSPDGMTCTKLSTPAFYIPTDDTGNFPTGYQTNSDAKAPAFVKMPGGETKLLLTYRMDRSTSGNTNGWIMIVDTVTGTNNGQIAIKYPPGGGAPVDEFGGLLGLAQNPQTGVVYGLRKTDDHFARELVTIDLTTGNTTLVGVLNEGTFGQAITTLAFVPDILITSTVRTGNNLTFTWTGAASPTFSLQTTTSLSPPVSWTTVASGLTGPTTTASITNSMGFFRISQP
jgi:hypothetical protein